jgi:hypothetical protein
MMGISELSDSDHDHVQAAKKAKLDPHYYDALTDSDDEQPHGPTVPVPPTTPSDGKAAPKFLEVFSGGGTLTKAFTSMTFDCVAVDIVSNPADDLSSGSCVARLLALAVSRTFQYVHFAPPCNTFSAARFPKLRHGSNYA